MKTELRAFHYDTRTYTDGFPLYKKRFLFRKNQYHYVVEYAIGCGYFHIRQFETSIFWRNYMPKEVEHRCHCLKCEDFIIKSKILRSMI